MFVLLAALCGCEGTSLPVKDRPADSAETGPLEDTGPFDADGDGTSAAEDCDDEDAAVHPGAEDPCDDAVDQDCDGLDAVCDTMEIVDLASVAVATGGHDVSRLASAGDVNGDGLSDLLIGSAPGGGHGAPVPEVCLALGFEEAAVDKFTCAATLVDTTFSKGFGYLGDPADGLGDIDLDGYDDFAVAMRPWTSFVSTPVGVFFGPSIADGDLQDAPRLIGGDDACPWFAASVAGVRDMDGDGVSDLVAGSAADLGDGAMASAAWLWHGPLTSDRGCGDADAAFIGEEDSAFFPVVYTVGHGDLDGDGLADLALGVPEAGDDQQGAIYIFSSPADGVQALDDADASLHGSGSTDALGSASTLVGDRNGDGYDELLAGAMRNESAGGMSQPGAAWVWHGPLRGAVLASDAALTVYGTTDLEQIGASVADGGRVLGDDGGAVLIGAPDATVDGVVWAGFVCLFAADRAGVTDMDHCDIRFQDPSWPSSLGHSLANVGDADGDSHEDLMLGTYTGNVYFVSGSILGE